MKVMAMYLPQFHRVKENDEWWGEGFTDWVAAKNAQPLYEGHYQPHVPLNGYYDLEKKETMQWQADLMKQYQVDGLCFYHYWFKDGRKILERPAENLLKWTDIDMPFCFSWANESWTRSWSKFCRGNKWASRYDGDRSDGDDGILLEQKYGDEKAWKRHFDYLIPFFKDSRYVKIENRPVFMIYKSDDIYCMDEMIECWHQLAADADIEKPYIILCNEKKKHMICAAHMRQEPLFDGSENMIKEKNCYLYDYDAMWEELLSVPIKNEKMYYGGYVGFDNTPRRDDGGAVITGSTPIKFKKYLTELMAKNAAAGNEWVFINAWNEWGEGMHLEPDVKYGYGYLEAIPYAKENYKEYLDKYSKLKSKSGESNAVSDKEIQRLEEQNARYEGYWQILDRWLQLKEEGVSIAEYITRRGYSEIAVYGMGMLGRHLMSDFEAAGVPIKYIIDRRANALKMDVPAYKVSDVLPKADAIIVTPTYDWDSIKRELLKITNAKIMRLDYLLMECE